MSHNEPDDHDHSAADAQPAGYYHSQKDRIFVRAIQASII